MNYVYLLWSHLEEGPEDLVATLDPSDLPQMAIECGWPDESKKLIEILPGLIGKKQIKSLCKGWGGLHVQVVKLRGETP